MLKRRKLILIAAALVGIALIVSTMSCAGSAKTRVEYVYITPDVPAFPVFPPPDCAEYDEAADLVTVPLWYWQKIAEYKIGVDAVDEYLLRLKKKAR